MSRLSMRSSGLALTSLAMLAFAGNSLLCRIALRDTEIGPGAFTALRIAAEVCAGRVADLPAEGEDLDRLPVRPELWLMGSAIEVAARIEAVLPGALQRLLPRLLNGVSS
jgi:hypothetical protein